MIAASPNDEALGNPKQHKGAVERLMSLTATAGLLGSTDGRFYARVAVGSRREVYDLKSASFRDWLIDGYIRAGHEVPSDWAIRRVLGALEATARSEGGTPSICVRVGHDGNGPGDPSEYYLDLGGDSGQAIKI